MAFDNHITMMQITVPLSTAMDSSHKIIMSNSKVAIEDMAVAKFIEFNNPSCQK
jgi:hypothetical protein